MKKPGRETEQAIINRHQDTIDGGTARTPTMSAKMDQLFEANRPQVYALCLRMVGSPARAEELTQETMLVAYSKLHTFEPSARFSTWLYSIAKNLCLNARRKRTELLNLEEDGVLEPTDTAQRSTLQQMGTNERIALFRDAAARLTSEEQEAVHLRYVEGQPLSAINRLLRLDSKTGARGLLQRCRRKLRRELLARLEELGHGESFLYTQS